MLLQDAKISKLENVLCESPICFNVVSELLLLNIHNTYGGKHIKKNF